MYRVNKKPTDYITIDLSFIVTSGTSLIVTNKKGLILLLSNNKN